MPVTAPGARLCRRPAAAATSDRNGWPTRTTLSPSTRCGWCSAHSRAPADLNLAPELRLPLLRLAAVLLHSTHTMKTLLPITALALSLFLPAGLAHAGDAKEELKELVTSIQTKLKAGKNTEQDLAENFAQFDKLLAAHKGEKTDDVAQILLMKAMLYIQVLDDEAKGLPLLTQLKKDFPDTKPALAVDKILESFEKQRASKEVQRKLAVGAKFPDFDEKDLAGKPLSIARFKGKVVLVDFWATWCGPCIGELPNVLKAYEKYHGKGFEIVGISLDSDRAKLDKFIADRKMTWPQYFDGQGWQTKLAGTYGVNSIPATYLLDGEGKIIAKNLRGEALEEAVAKALKK